MAFVVGQGGQECGIRLALGAEPRDILGLAFRPGLMLTATGTLVGLGVSVVVLGIATMAAGFIPARRATRVSPLQVLK